MRNYVIFAMLICAGCRGPAVEMPTSGPGPKSPSGWEIRYNATLALARRGSPHVKDPEVWDSFLELLDAEQQLRNFRNKSEDGQIKSDENGAYTAVISALQAAQDLHRKDPKIDLSGLKAPIEKLTHNPNATVSVQAKQALLTLFPPS